MICATSLMHPFIFNRVATALPITTLFLLRPTLTTAISTTSRRRITSHDGKRVYPSCFAYRLLQRPSAIDINHIVSSSLILRNQQSILYSSNKSDHDTSTSTVPQQQLSPEEIAASLGPDRHIATKPFTWEELKWIVQHGDPTMHSRSMEVQGKYLLHSREIKKMWRSMNDYILYSKFGFEKVLEYHDDDDGHDDDHGSTGGKYVSKPCLKDLQKEKRLEKRLLRNEYPYYVDEGIEHWCLWKLGGKIEACDIDLAVEQMKNDNYEKVLAWVNPPHLQSIPDIDHAHLLCLKSV
eukprot:CAMPEP_0176484340 /NCGR_PEP_ID=MMETSP0200_2-20121128/4400_1 /TAXON_ID=947934 /ORGANISM="Chaetoceros sp., Strain GSL56" /LENGTH=293 /DNA_ID=CAMNT_0017880803 /DNA_START=184 /DNA_END=1065 /DNA_ORIENTATION=-